MNRLLNISRLALSGAASLKGRNLKPFILARHSFNLNGTQQSLGFHSHSVNKITHHQNRNSMPSPEGTDSQLKHRLASHPQIMQQLLEFIAFLGSKGFDPSVKKLNFFQVMNIVRDHEVQQKGQELSMALEKADIHVDRATITEIREALINKTFPFAEPPSTGPEDTIDTHDTKNNDQQQDDGPLNQIRK